MCSLDATLAVLVWPFDLERSSRYQTLY